MAVTNFPAYTGTALSRNLTQVQFDEAEEYFQSYQAEWAAQMNSTTIPQLNALEQNCLDAEAAAVPAASTAVSASELAEKWASEGVDTIVLAGKYSAFHWATKAYEYVATLATGAINDSITSLTATWSSTKLSTLVIDQTVSASSKTAPVDADQFGIVDSADANSLKKTTLANIKAAIISAFGVMIGTATAKDTPVDGDIFIIGDSAASFVSKKTTLANIKAAFASVFAPLSTVGSLGAQGAQSTSFTLTQAMAGKLQVLTAGGLTITLPAINSITSGSCFILRNGATTSSTIALNGNSHDMDYLTIQPFETICLQCDGGSNYRLLYRRATEYISNAYGEAIKFDNGMVMMNVFVNATGSTPSVGSTTLVKPLPVQLVSPETASVTFTQGVGGSILLASAMGYCADVNNATLIIGNTTGSARTYVVTRATVFGRWK